MFVAGPPLSPEIYFYSIFLISRSSIIPCHVFTDALASQLDVQKGTAGIFATRLHSRHKIPARVVSINGEQHSQAHSETFTDVFLIDLVWRRGTTLTLDGNSSQGVGSGLATPTS